MESNISPLRYPGGKKVLYPFLAETVELNKPITTYVEAFAGGAALGLALLANGHVDRIILNDIDERVYAFWWSVLHRTDEMIKLIEKTRVSVPEWKRQTALLRRTSLSKDHDLLAVGFAAFFLNRTSRSGIFDAGPIGGFKQQGKWKLTARYNKHDLISRIQLIGALSSRIELHNKDALKLMRKLEQNCSINKKQTLIYLDPPYYVMGRELYRKYFTDLDHKRLRNYLRADQQFKWVLSYDAAPEISRLYRGHRKNGVEFNHFAFRARVKSELIISSDNCILPKFPQNMKRHSIA